VVIDEQRDGGVAILRLDHGKVNALDVELLDALTERLAVLNRSPAPALVLTGSGRVFSAGVDLLRVIEGGGPYIDMLVPALSRTFEALFSFPRPVVAAINGAAIAGGCILACGCDRRLMTDSGSPIGASELLVGVPFPAAALEILRYACGDRTEDAVLTARLFTGPDAVGAGLVHEYVPADDLLKRAVAVAGELGSMAADSYRMAKSQLRQPALDRIAASEVHDSEVRRIWSSPETAIAIRAQLDRVASRGR
jgi:enoyl-CoA hydratase/carnithine racemase